MWTRHAISTVGHDARQSLTRAACAVRARDFALFPDMGDRLIIDPFWKKSHESCRAWHLFRPDDLYSVDGVKAVAVAADGAALARI